jgi:hypothetical protein
VLVAALLLPLVMALLLLALLPPSLPLLLVLVLLLPLLLLPPCASLAAAPETELRQLPDELALPAPPAGASRWRLAGGHCGRPTDRLALPAPSGMPLACAAACWACHQAACLPARSSRNRLPSQAASAGSVGTR